ncbi:hypothetical protein M9978_07130 [Sphingomonas sp. MG17]|uniref:Uncharacterized protein n=1 Tax=Sphingomonas tagetis TaxID=2949092 RepID=A0A9X2HQR1_9SPHN|nr:hypothetical protein [Sphingomonas tagetis]
MKRARPLHISRIALIGIAMVGASACSEKGDAPGQGDNATAAASGAVPAAKHTPNPSMQAPPSKAFGQFERIDAGKFHSTEQFTVFNPAAFPGTVDSIQYQYVYTDDRLASARPYNFDVTLKIFKFASAAQAKASLDRGIAGAIPIAEAGKVQLPPCSGQKRDADQFVGPDKIVKTIPNPRGGEVTIRQPGDFNMYDCTRGHNPEESAVWVEGEYYFVASALALKVGDKPEGRVEDLAKDYLAALGPR